MPRVHTHYDNLKVARDAPMEVIHALYVSSSSVPSATSAPPAASPFTAVGTPEPTPIQSRPRFVRPGVTPNGEPWPTTSGYPAGYRQLNTDGESSLTVDNRKRDS